MGGDESVANAARVSFAKSSDNYTPEQNAKLIAYLAKHKHFSPFNHAFLSFRIKAPIFVSRQLVKHKFMPWNEVSRRYVDSEPEFFMPDVWRAKAENVKQGSSDERAEGMYTVIDQGEWSEQPALYEFVEWQVKDALQMYNDMLKAGVCAEQARMILPACMMTEWIWSGTLGAFADMLKLRLDPHTQKETRDVAQMIYNEAVKLFPVSLPALLENK